MKVDISMLCVVLEAQAVDFWVSIMIYTGLFYTHINQKKLIAAAEIAELQKSGKLPTDDMMNASKENTTPSPSNQQQQQQQPQQQQPQQQPQQHINLQT